tara:strand:+ start:3136 stop:3306 length:171 start_codon:yes stop_codon:yes gene_type:complete
MKSYDYTNRFDVHLDDKEDENGLFYVYDNEKMEVVSKGYKYSRYAYNLQSKLQLGY